MGIPAVHKQAFVLEVLQTDRIVEQRDGADSKRTSVASSGRKEWCWRWPMLMSKPTPAQGCQEQDEHSERVSIDRQAREWRVGG